MRTLEALRALEQRYAAMTHAAARQDWDALTAIEAEAAALQERMANAGFEVEADEAGQATEIIERILAFDRTVREHARPYLAEAAKALNESREELVQSTRSHAVQRAYGKLTPR